MTISIKHNSGTTMNRTLRHAILLAFAVSVSAAPAFAQKKAEKADSAILATVNGKAIPKTRFDAMIAGPIAQGQPDSPEFRQNVKEELVRREILMQEALKKGFDKKPDVQIQIDINRQNVLIGAYLNDYVRTHPITADQIKMAYEEVKSRLGSKEYKVRHVLVENENEAKAIIAKLTKGEKIEDLAKDSKDPGSKDRGGDLGWATPSSFVPPFSAAMTKLEKSKFTETPVKSDFGWHVIQLEDTREFNLPPLDDTGKNQLSQQLTQRMVQQHIEGLRSKTKVD
jgi:peptidyl-prolyl cis-trans isomerase C